MKLIEGKKYNLTFKWGEVKGVFYMGFCDNFCGQTCDCCNKELEQGYLFHITNKNGTYQDCLNGKYTEQIKLGTTCINKVEITEYKGE